jgi:hypothetical protein
MCSREQRMEGFLVPYTKITKEDIRRNRDNVGERLGFLGRIIHGTNPRAWLIGEYFTVTRTVNPDTIPTRLNSKHAT